MADWAETPVGKLINLDRASVVTVAESDQKVGMWVVLVQIGTVKHFCGEYATRTEAGLAAKLLVYGEDD